MDDVEANVTRDFDTNAEAGAFIDGINYFRDEGIIVLGTEPLEDGRARVLIFDDLV